MIHIAKQQKVVTHVSHVEVFVNGIKILIGKNCPWLLYHSFWISWSLDLQELKVAWIPKQARLCPRNKEPACSKSTKYVCCTMMQNANHYEWNVIRKMLEHHAQNIETLCWNIILKSRLYAQNTEMRIYIDNFQWINCVVGLTTLVRYPVMQNSLL